MAGRPAVQSAPGSPEEIRADTLISKWVSRDTTTGASIGDYIAPAEVSDWLDEHQLGHYKENIHQNLRLTGTEDIVRISQDKSVLQKLERCALSPSAKDRFLRAAAGLPPRPRYGATDATSSPAVEMQALGPEDAGHDAQIETQSPTVPVCEALKVLWMSIPISCAKAGRKVQQHCPSSY